MKSKFSFHPRSPVILPREKPMAMVSCVFVTKFLCMYKHVYVSICFLLMQEE